MKPVQRYLSPLAVVATVLLFAACSTPQKIKPTPPKVRPPANTTAPGQVYATPGVSVRYTSAAFADLPSWSQQNFGKSLQAFVRGCQRIGSTTQWQQPCQVAQGLPRTDAAAKDFFEYYFTPWQISDNSQTSGTITGYYEPVLHGSVQPTAKAKFPIYGIPNDFVVVNLPAQYLQSKGVVRIAPSGANRGVISASGAYSANLGEFPLTERSKSLKGRFEGNRFVPYYTRAQINAGALNGKAPILGYADDAVELFFLHVQGSGRMQTPDGRYVRLGFADKNDHPYRSIAQYMANRGYLPLAQTHMQGIKAWMQQNPNRLAEVLGQNPSYVFFRQTNDTDPDAGPVGAMGVPLTNGYSAAVDRHHVELGAPLFVATTHPVQNTPHNRLLMAQDTGTAIRGGVRVDYFWGYGDEAGAVAGKMKHPGQVWMLLPNGYSPRYRP